MITLTADSAPPRTRVQSLGSGSSGNAYIVSAGSTTVLVDCGVGVRQITGGLARLGLTLGDVTALVISHEHTDHVRAVSSALRSRVPVLLTLGTAGALGLHEGAFRSLTPDTAHPLGDTVISVVATSHDAAEPCGITLATPGGVVSILTDMGCPSEAVIRAAASSDLLVLEANHDAEMLRLGPYPPHLKRRVGSDVGHLSNRQAGEVLADALTKRGQGPSTIWLAHLSATNNRPALARETVLRVAGAKLRGRTVDVLPRLAAGPVWTTPPARATQLSLLGL